MTTKLLQPLFHLLYPHTCLGCGNDVLGQNDFLCIECIFDLPHTGFADQKNNPVEKIFWGRLPVESAMSEFYFIKDSMIQNLIHELKYKGNKKAGKYLGNLIGKSLMFSQRFLNVDVLVPLPLFESKEKKRGFNQSEILCQGIAEVFKKPVIAKNVIRKIATDTQTKKGRTQRWLNVESSFSVTRPHELQAKHILLVDDVVTTGATLEACGHAIIGVKDIRISIATLAVATH